MFTCEVEPGKSIWNVSSKTYLNKCETNWKNCVIILLIDSKIGIRIRKMNKVCNFSTFIDLNKKCKFLDLYIFQYKFPDLYIFQYKFPDLYIFHSHFYHISLRRICLEVKWVSHLCHVTRAGHPLLKRSGLIAGDSPCDMSKGGLPASW